MEELKPCPFCGAELKHYTDEYTNSYGKRVKEDYYMHDVTASANYCLAEEICVGNNEKDIALWNTRPDGWISVDERLPEREQDVLISGVRKFSTGKTVKFVTQAFYEDGSVSVDNSGYTWYDCEACDWDYDTVAEQYLVPQGWWESATYCEQFAAVDDSVTHWQPLPEPPKGE